ncbi:MAG: hemolysin family protein [Phycisphaerales bacterium]
MPTEAPHPFMPAIAIPILITLVALLCVVAVLSSLETVLFSLSYHDRSRLKRLSPPAERAAAKLLSQPRALLVLILFFNMIAVTLYFVLSTILGERLEKQWMSIALGAFNLLAMTVLSEVISKMIAGRYRVELARVMSIPALIAFTALRPLRVFLDRGVIAPLTRLVVSTGEGAAELSGEELSELLAQGKRQGAIDADEQRMLRQVIHFGERRVREIMVPRVQMEWLDEKATAPEVAELVRRTRLTRVPICRGSLDDEVIGLLHSKKYMASVAAGRAPALSESCEPVRYVPQTATLDKLLETMRTGGVKVALVVDEFGAVVGAVATQDLVRTLISELTEQEAEGEEEPQVQLVGLGIWSVPGRFSVREWARMFKMEDQSRVSTVAGLVFARLGRLPRVGDVVRLGNVRLEVARVHGRVAEEVLLSLIETPAERAEREAPR